MNEHNPVYIVSVIRGRTQVPIETHIERFDYTDSEEEFDELRITLGGDGVMVYIDSPHILDDGKSFIRFKWGYKGAMSEERQAVIVSLEPRFPSSGHVTLDIVAHDKGSTMSGIAQQVWKRKEGYTEDELAKEIAKRYNLNAVVEPSVNRHLRWSQGSLSDIAFLEKLTHSAVSKDRKKKGHYRVYVEGDTLYFKPSNIANPPIATYEYFTGTRRELISFSPRMNVSKSKESSVTSVGIDTRKNQNTASEANNTNTDRPTLGTEHGNKIIENGNKNVKIDARTGKVINSTQNNKVSYYRGVEPI